MIRVQLPNRLLGIGFEHKSVVETGGPSEAYTLLLGRPVLDTIDVRQTHCTLYELTPDETKHGKYLAAALAQGVARCSPLDNFKKEVGRKTALTRALKVLFPGPKDNPELTAEAIQYNKSMRDEVWKGYHSRWVNDAMLQLEANIQEQQTDLR